jgi:hypothetical protein
MGRYPPFLAVALLFVAGLSVGSAQTNLPTSEMPPDFTVAFIGDQGSGSSADAVLRLIKSEGADMVIHGGDFDYNNNPTAWDNKITAILGADFPYFASIGNHDTAAWSGTNGYQAKLQARLSRILGAQCSGDLGVKSACTYQGLFFILSGVGTAGSGHVAYLAEQLTQTDAIWRICSWHKNQRLMQVGGKGDEVGWGAYETCREGGAIIATAHEHSYARTHLLDHMQTQHVASTADPLVLEKGKTFVFHSGLGGNSIRDQELGGPWWASIYTSTQGANYGALFCAFNADGDANRASCYFKDIDGVIPDQFEVITAVAGGVNSAPVAVNDNATTAEDMAVTIGVLGNDSDPDGDPLTVASVTPRGTGRATIKADNTVTYTPGLNFNGSESLTYTIRDGRGGHASATVSVTVTAVNDPPVAGNQSVNTGPNTPVAISLPATDPDNDALRYVIVTGPTHGALSGTAPNLTYTPSPNYSGPDSFAFQALEANAPGAASNVATISITVSSPSAVIATDGFEMGTYAGGAGWKGPWTRSGEVSIRTNTDGPQEGSRHVRLRSKSGYLKRSVDLTGATNIPLASR